MAIDVSVVIPFFNPGADIDECLESMLAQTLPRERFEVIALDDGSTDGSADLVDAWVARHPNLLRVLHLPASGSPAHPRNVGIAQARGRYIQFVDSDDSLAPGALARLLEVADASSADIVIGKISSDFRGVYQPLFRQTVTGRTVADYPLMNNLTVCKMFRRDFLIDHDIRLPEGPAYIEDQHLCVQAYGHATSVAVVADTVCYLYRSRRGAGMSRGDTSIDPATYFRELGSIMDIIDGPGFPAAARRDAYARYYRTEMLGRLRGPSMLGYDEAYRDQMLAAVRGLADTRVPVEVDAGLPVFPRVQARLLRAGDGQGLLDLARRLATISLRATAELVGWDHGSLRVRVSAQLVLDGQPLRLEREARGWLLPHRLAPTVAADVRRLGDAGDRAVDLDVTTTSRADGTVWSTTDGLELRVADDGGVSVGGDVSIDPRQVAGGHGLTSGLWDLRLRVSFGGLTWGSRLSSSATPAPDLDGWLRDGGGVAGCVTPYWTGEAVTLSLDVGQWMTAAQDLIDEAPSAQLDESRILTIDVPRLRGESAALTVELVIESTASNPDGAVSMQHCRAHLQTEPAGSSIVAQIPRLPASSSGWNVWLRMGPPGSVTPRRLGLQLREESGHRLRVIAEGTAAEGTATEGTAAGGTAAEGRAT